MARQLFLVAWLPCSVDFFLRRQPPTSPRLIVQSRKSRAINEDSEILLVSFLDRMPIIESGSFLMATRCTSTATATGT